MPKASHAIKNKRKRYIALTVIITIIISLLGAGYVYLVEQEKRAIALQKRAEEDARAQAENERILREKEEEQRATLLKKYMKDMTAELSAHAKAYKKKRRLLREIILPFHYETPEYAKESYQFFTNDITPSLESQSDEIMGVFEKYTKMVKQDLGEGDTKLTKEFLNAWQSEVKKQIEHYVDFFIAEQKYISAHRDLITFYYKHSKRFTVNTNTNDITFKYAKDKDRRDLLLKNIETLKNKGRYNKNTDTQKP